MFATLVLLVILAGGLNQTARTPYPDEVRISHGRYQPASAAFAVEKNLIEVGVTVHDRKGAPVGGLTKSDFEVFDAGKRQEILSFSERHTAAAPGSAVVVTPTQIAKPPTQAASAVPRYIALFFDDTRSGMAGFARSKAAAKKLIAEGLQPGDHVGIYTGSGAVTLDFTQDTKVLLETLEKMRRHPDRTVDMGVGACPRLTAYQSYAIVNHLDGGALQVAVADILTCAPETPMDQAVMQAQQAAANAWDMLRHQPSTTLDVLAIVVKQLAAAPGERMLLMVSPGFVTAGMEKQLAALTDSLLRARIVMNALDDEGLASGVEIPESLGETRRAGWLSRSMATRTMVITSFLADAAAATGGRFIKYNNDLAGGLRTLAAAPEVSYLMSFSPSDPRDGKYHKLKVTMPKPVNNQVTARAGYFSDLPAKLPESAQKRIDRVVASSELLEQVPARVEVNALQQKNGQYEIQVDITLDAKRLPFSQSNGKGLQQLTFVTVLRDADGNYIDGKQAVMDMALTSATRAEMETKGLKASTSFTVPKGSYQIREVIREAVHNQIAASTTAIPIR